MERTTWTPGLAWKNDKFYSFDANSVLVMRMWPEMRAWRRTASRPWLPTRKWADRLLCSAPMTPGEVERTQAVKAALVGPLHDSQFVDPFFRASDATLSAISSIPGRVRAIAARFSNRRWHVLALMARCEWATDLLEANPALGFALASSWILQKPAVTQPMRAARSLLKKPQVSIMEWLGLPATERVRRILMRISPDALAARKLPQLNAALHRPDIQALLAHLPVISEQALKFVCSETVSHRLTPKFLTELSQPGACSDDARAHRDAPDLFTRWLGAHRMTRELNRELPDRLLSIPHLVRWHEDLSSARSIVRRQAEERFTNLVSTRCFDAEPLPGRDGITPIRTAKELFDEGIAMGHCVASYLHSIVENHYFVYRVTHPVRAALGVMRREERWVIDQITGAGNQKISEAHQDEIWARLTQSE